MAVALIALTAVLAFSLLALWKSLGEQKQNPRELRITGVDFYHSHGERLWGNYNPKKDWIFVVKQDEVLEEISPENVIGMSETDKVIQYKDGLGNLKTLFIERFLGPPNCIRTQNKLVINQF